MVGSGGEPGFQSGGSTTSAFRTTPSSRLNVNCWRGARDSASAGFVNALTAVAAVAAARRRYPSRGPGGDRGGGRKELGGSGAEGESGRKLFPPPEGGVTGPPSRDASLSKSRTGRGAEPD